jgi:hypothetical protein
VQSFNGIGFDLVCAVVLLLASRPSAKLAQYRRFLVELLGDKEGVNDAG